MPILAMVLAAAANPAPMSEAKARAWQWAEDDSLRRAEASRERAGNLVYRQQFLEAMRLNAFPGDCVAYDPAQGDCIVTVREFNETATRWSSSDLDTSQGPVRAEDVERARARNLVRILEERFPLREAARLGLGDSLASLLRNAQEESVRQFRRNLGEPVLQSLYRAYYERLFREREERIYQVLGSSDSALADSLWLNLPGRKDSMESKLPWQVLRAGDLPGRAESAWRTLKAGEAAPPLRMPYGFLLGRLVSTRVIPEVSYEKAIPILVGLASVPSRKDLAADSAIAAYYRHNRKKFVTPDTVHLRTWLLPNPPRRRPVPDGNLPDKPGRFLEDTARIRPQLVRHDALPEALQERISAYYPCPIKKLIGPLKSVFGTWYFQPLSVVPGGRPLSLAEAGKDIRRELFGADTVDAVRLSRLTRESKAKDMERHFANLLLDQRLALSENPAGSGTLSEQPAPPGGGVRLPRREMEWMQRELSIRFIKFPETP